MDRKNQEHSENGPGDDHSDQLDTRRYVTVEGPTSIEPWQDTPAHIKRLKELYTAMGRAPKGTDEEFAKQMRGEERNLVLITPERLYGSLRAGA